MLVKSRAFLKATAPWIFIVLTPNFFEYFNYSEKKYPRMNPTGLKNFCVDGDRIDNGGIFRYFGIQTVTSRNP
jgi:hypothetical protein